MRHVRPLTVPRVASLGQPAAGAVADLLQTVTKLLYPLGQNPLFRTAYLELRIQTAALQDKSRQDE